MPSFDLNEPQVAYSDEEEEIVSEGEEIHRSGMADCGGIDSSDSAYSHNQENVAEGKVHLFKEEQVVPNKYILEVTSNCSSELKNSSGGNLSNICEETTEDGWKFCTVEIIRVAAERYIQFSTQQVNNDLTMSIHPYGYALSGLSMEDTQDVELVYLLLDAAEKVGCQQFYMAGRLLSHCEWKAFDSGNPVQRIAFYFAESLRARIDNETGRITERTTEEVRYRRSLLLGTNVANLACHQEIPFTQVMQLTAIQTISENVSMDTKVHLIDLCIRSGVQWTSLIQALAEKQDNCPIELLKITAIGTTDKENIESIGNSLLSFAKSSNFPFSFKVVFLSDMQDVKDDIFDIEADETVVVYSASALRTMLSSPDCLENLMGVIKRLKPSVMVVMEVEANHNSPSFVNRFIEALFFYGAFFDCLEDCMERDNQYRMMLEGIHLGHGIQDIIATEGKERFTRNVKMDVWRALFARFGMEEIELSESSLYQANLVLEQFTCWSSCTLESNGKSLIVGWKGTPIHSLSVWKFF